MTAEVLLADPQVLFRSALRVALEAEDDLVVVGEVGDGAHLLTEIGRLRPGAVLLAHPLGDRDGLDLCEAIKSDDHAPRVLLLTDQPNQATLRSALTVGADGYTSKDSSLGDLVRAVRAVANGEAWVPTSMLGVLLSSLIEQRRVEDAVVERFARLSRREREVLALLVDGHDQHGIADILVISPDTARTHVQNIRNKLEVRSRLEAVALAVEHNLLERFTA